MSTADAAAFSIVSLFLYKHFRSAWNGWMPATGFAALYVALDMHIGQLNQNDLPPFCACSVTRRSGMRLSRSLCGFCIGKAGEGMNAFRRLSY